MRPPSVSGSCCPPDLVRFGVANDDTLDMPSKLNLDELTFEERQELRDLAFWQLYELPKLLQVERLRRSLDRRWRALRFLPPRQPGQPRAIVARTPRTRRVVSRSRSRSPGRSADEPHDPDVVEGPA